MSTFELRTRCVRCTGWFLLKPGANLRTLCSTCARILGRRMPQTQQDQMNAMWRFTRDNFGDPTAPRPKTLTPFQKGSFVFVGTGERRHPKVR